MTDNVIATPTVFAKAGLALLKNNLVMTRKVSTQYSAEYARTGAKAGQTVKAKRHPEFTVRDGRVADVQDLLEGEVSITLGTQKGVDYKFTSIEAALSLDTLLLDKALDAAMSQLAQQVDSDLFSAAYKSTYSWAGTPGQTINAATDFFKGPERLADMSVPQNDRHAVLSVRDGYALAGSFTAGAAWQSDMSKSAVERARIPMIADVDPVWSQSVKSHTNGAWAGSPLIKGASQNVTYNSCLTTYTQSLLVDGFTNATTIKKGDVFKIDGVYAVNRRTKEALDYLQQFVVTSADATFSTSGSSEITLTISPPIITSGAYQTVDAAPANDAALTLIGTGSTAYAQNLCFHREAFVLVTADLPMPFGQGEAHIERDPDSGLSLRYWRYSDGRNDEHNHRFDIIYGAQGLDARLATRLSGTA
jgi:hypothetical protein